ncbi:hypothetical protein GCM10007301_22530 [Azorhizobium oxalatiphilum]|uniref:Peptidase S8/S53 domain-containing protein n=2 Tax=Azorhizobium oxalatiphilum TaxID=980631 RepID=A0A917BZA8_9HYPH|nr:hypothetical protein GCM10007301_22530 [Azorhizobium oxalatiphilum]
MMRAGFAAGGGDVLAAEPDFEQEWPSAPRTAQCVAEPQERSGGKQIGPHDRWHLDAAFSSLGSARDKVDAAALRDVLIAHVDTGYDPDHRFRPKHLDPAERSFVAGDADPNSARDVSKAGKLTNHGHGTGTIGILAGPTIGGAPGARVLPIRIADSVVRFRTGTMAQGFDYALAKNAQVLTLSMGGLASSILADAVNKCYAAGLVMVAAAGNNFSGLPVRSIVYPARMRRVIAACGVMANMKSYSDLDAGTMEGCYGPASKMLTALSGFTPNIPWPEIGCPNVIDENGQGTSSATPQIAAAAALWLAHHAQTLRKLPQPWMRGEAARRALFASASLGGGSQPDGKLGWGALRAEALLQQTPLAASALSPEAPASAGYAWLKLLTGEGVGFALSNAAEADRLLGLELMQLAQRDPALEAALADPDHDGVTAAQRRLFLEAAEASPLASRPLKAAIGASLSGRGQQRLSPPPPRAATPEVTPNPVPPPARRRLRIYALDPSLGGSLNSYEDQIATVDVRNEPNLRPGPVGEYLEVVDIDPASNRAYPPVDLNNPNLMLQDGAPPSEGNPAFHQQMVYAVAMRTIEHFEFALGRKALWTRRWSGKKGTRNIYMQRLRIYPHALRQDNAYYSPAHGALMFGYFPANSQVSDLTPPGTMVFSCLSADVVAHETTHALLDGQSRSLRDPSNPDVRAFHEAFADIVALFQQFTYRDLVRREIARARGDLSAAGLLRGLARQFGEGTGHAGPLRRYAQQDATIAYGTTFSPHARGSLLVAAVYRAFLAIVERRTADLVRLATGGGGILPAGALHPDLVARLTEQTCKSAQHVLRMCIRAIDYCPPVDLTFGEYLRAIITADMEEVPEDRYGYRVAFLEAFRAFQILPRNLRTVSLETLRWHPWDGPSPQWLSPAIAALKIDLTTHRNREEIFNKSEENGRKLHAELLKALNSPEACMAFGLQHGLGTYKSLDAKPELKGPTTFLVDDVRVAKRVREDGELAAQLMVVIRQRRPESLAEASQEPTKDFWFRGGVTLIIDLLGEGAPRIRYVILKAITSPTRLALERAYRGGEGNGGLRSMYFGADGFAAGEPFAILHASRDTE